LRSVAADKGILDIQTKRLALTFEIGSLYVKLIEKTEPEFQHLIDKEMTPGNLLIELSKCGVHLMPDDKDAKTGEITLKDRAAEERAIQDITTSIGAYAFRSSKWSRPAPSEKVLVKFRENLEYDREFFEDYEGEWR